MVWLSMTATWLTESFFFARVRIRGDARRNPRHGQPAKHANLPNRHKIVPYLDRDDLVHYTTHTVLHNLAEGLILVVIILSLFSGMSAARSSWR